MALLTHGGSSESSVESYKLLRVRRSEKVIKLRRNLELKKRIEKIASKRRRVLHYLRVVHWHAMQFLFSVIQSRTVRTIDHVYRHITHGKRT